MKTKRAADWCAWFAFAEQLRRREDGREHSLLAKIIEIATPSFGCFVFGEFNHERGERFAILQTHRERVDERALRGDDFLRVTFGRSEKKMTRAQAQRLLKRLAVRLKIAAAFLIVRRDLRRDPRLDPGTIAQVGCDFVS